MSGSEEHHKTSEKKDRRHEHKNHGRRQKPAFSILGDSAGTQVMILWRNKYISAAVLAGATLVWLLFQRIGYPFITFFCRFAIHSLAALFLWSFVSFYVNKTSFNLPEIVLPEDLCNRIVLSLIHTCNKGIWAFREVALGKDTKKFLHAVLALWLVSVIGSWFDFLTIVYVLAVMILISPLLYEERNEEKVDSYAQKANSRITKQHNTQDEKVRHKLNRVPCIVEKHEEEQQHEESMPASGSDGERPAVQQ